MTSHLSVSVTPSQAGATVTTGLTSQGAAKAAAPPSGFGSILDALHAIETAAAGNVAGALQALTKSTPTAETGAATPTGFVHLDSTGSASIKADGAMLASLTSTAAASTTAPATGFSTAAAVSDKGTLLDALAKLLPGVAKTTADGKVAVPLAATAAVDATADTDATEDTTEAPATAGTPPKLLNDLVGALKDLDKAEQSGKPVDKDLLKRVKHAIDALSNFLAAQQPTPAPPVAAEATPAAAAAGVDAVGAVAPPSSLTAPAVPGIAAAASQAAAGTPADTGDADTQPVVDNSAASPAPESTAPKQVAATKAARSTLGALVDKLETLSSGIARDQPNLAARLDTLARSLDPKTLAGSTLSALGLDPTGPAADPKLAAAINGLVNGKAQSAAALQPVLAAPALKLPDGTALASAAAPKTKGTGIAHDTPESDIVTPTKSAAPAPSDPPRPADVKAATMTAAVVAAATHEPADKPADDAPATQAPAATAATTAATAVTSPAAPLAHAGIRQVQDAYQAAAPAAINLPQMAFEISRHAQAGSNHFQIRLDPADMGRVDVKLSVDSTGSVSAHLTVERSETLDLLKRDSGSLGQALTQAGLDGSKTNLQFSLSQNPFTRQDNGSAYTPPAASADADTGSPDPVATVAMPALYRGVATANGLNIFV